MNLLVFNNNIQIQCINYFVAALYYLYFYGKNKMIIRLQNLRLFIFHILIHKLLNIICRLNISSLKKNL